MRKTRKGEPAAAVAGGPYGGRKARERARRGAEVLAAARRLFTTKGYRQTTMVEIAAAAELALGTLYQLFPSKADMLYRLLEEHVDGLIARTREAIAAEHDASAQVARIVRAQLALFQDNADLLGLYLSGLIGYDVTLREQFGDRLDAKYHEYLQVLTGVFRRGIRARAFVARSPQRLAMALAGMINAAVRARIRTRQGDLTEAAEDILAVFFHGAAMPPPARSGR